MYHQYHLQCPHIQGHVCLPFLHWSTKGNCVWMILFTLWRPAAFEDSHAKTTGLHVALPTRNSGAESGRELLKGSKDLAILLVFTRKKFFGWGASKWRTFRKTAGFTPKPRYDIFVGRLSKCCLDWIASHYSFPCLTIPISCSGIWHVLCFDLDESF